MRIEDMTEAESLDLLLRVGFGRLGCAYKSQPYVVPMYFACSGRILYGFATFGQKIRWMRANPLVCIEAEERDTQLGWKTVVAFGRYEELSDMPEWDAERERAQALLEERDWWQGPALVTSAHRGGSYDVWYRIHMERLTGFRAILEAAGIGASSRDVPTARSRGWFGRLIRPRQSGC
jgi:nitroimidazol reductase NimA-like FMN-containing flavoprotein (pyridoxamine 5'-phosphate oxidase superfamily)